MIAISELTTLRPCNVGGRLLFVETDGDNYVFLYDSGTPSIRCFKKATSESAFSEKDSANRPTANLVGNAFDARSDGSKIRLIWQDSSTYAVSYKTFDTSTDSWGATEVVLAAFTPPGAFSCWCALSLDSNSKPHAIYHRQAKVKGVTYNYVCYKNKVEAAWSAEEIVEQEEGYFREFAAGHESDNRFVAIYSSYTLQYIRCRTRSSAGSWDTAQQIPGASGTPCFLSLILDSNSNKRALHAAGGTTALYYATAPSGADATWSSVYWGVAGSTVHLGYRGTYLYGIFAISPTGIRLKKKENGTWTAPETIAAGDYTLCRIQQLVGADGFSYIFKSGADSKFYWDTYPPPTYSHGLKVVIGGVAQELALCAVGTNPLRIRKGGVTYGIELVDVTDTNASKIRIKTPAGIKALRKYT